MAEEEIDLYPITTKAPAVKKRPREVPTAPANGSLHISVYSVVLKGGSETFTKSRFSRVIEIKNAITSIIDPTSSTTAILSGELHRIVVKFFGELADETIEKIRSCDGEITESSLMGDGHADCKVNK